MALEAGEVDAIGSNLYDEVASVMANPNLDVFTGSLGIETLVFNHRIAPFDDVNVRRAINYAIDKERAVEIRYGGIGEAAYSHISVVQDPRLVGFPYNPELARHYLELAGFPNGQGFPVIQIETIDGFRDYAQIIQSNLSDIGITAEVRIGEATAFVTRLAMGEMPFGLLGYGLGSVPASYINMFTSTGGFNFTGYANPEVDRLLAAAASEVNDARRHELYVQACLLLEQDAVYGIVSYQRPMTIFRSNLEFIYRPEAFIFPEYTRLR
jgi:peptide/nickel transport system substrate-binding protein/oligopeptide transport system substrate-binding protein